MPGGILTGLPTAPVTNLARPAGGRFRRRDPVASASSCSFRQERTDAGAQLDAADRDLRPPGTSWPALESAMPPSAPSAAAVLPPGDFAADLHGLSLLERMYRGDEAEGAPPPRPAS
jgi:hypothetical protein